MVAARPNSPSSQPSSISSSFSSDDQLSPRAAHSTVGSANDKQQTQFDQQQQQQQRNNNPDSLTTPQMQQRNSVTTTTTTNIGNTNTNSNQNQLNTPISFGANAAVATQRPLKTKHRKINKQHPEFELTYDMMLGIRTVVGAHHNQLAMQQQLSNAQQQNENKDLKDKQASAASSRTIQLQPSDFTQTQTSRFPGKGSLTTPGHAMRDFKFKDYSPAVFRAIRANFGIDPIDYLLCVCGNFQFLEFISNSKSGQFFFYTHDRQ
jgi:hypothetical protein